jgi:hypothetical protein
MQAACDAQHRFAAAQSADEPEETLEKLERRLLLMIRYKTALENSKNRTLREIEMMLARAKREECQERVVFMKENAVALNIVATQTKLGIPHSTPYRPAPEIRHGELRTENREPAEKHP